MKKLSTKWSTALMGFSIGSVAWVILALVFHLSLFVAYWLIGGWIFGRIMVGVETKRIRHAVIELLRDRGALNSFQIADELGLITVFGPTLGPLLRKMVDLGLLTSVEKTWPEVPVHRGQPRAYYTVKT